jgi:HEAT repeat protein
MKHEIEKLAAELVSGTTETRRAAAIAVSQLGQEAQAAAIALATAAADPDEAVREFAVSALEDLGPPQLSDLDALAGLTANAPPDAAYWAATLVGRAGADAALGVAGLVAALETRREPEVRERLVWALGEIGHAASAASPAIAAAAAEPNCPPRLARLCRSALQSIGSKT